MPHRTYRQLNVVLLRWIPTRATMEELRGSLVVWPCDPTTKSFMQSSWSVRPYNLGCPFSLLTLICAPLLYNTPSQSHDLKATPFLFRTEEQSRQSGVCQARLFPYHSVLHFTHATNDNWGSWLEITMSHLIIPCSFGFIHSHEGRATKIRF